MEQGGAQTTQKCLPGSSAFLGYFCLFVVLRSVFSMAQPWEYELLTVFICRIWTPL